MSKHKKQHFLMKFKTLIILAVLFIALGSWLLPHYHTVHYHLGDSIDHFPVLVEPYYSSNSAASPDLVYISNLTGTERLQTEPTDFEEELSQRHIYFNRVETDGQTQYQIKAVTNIQTITAAYFIVDNKPQPIYQRASGLTIWTEAFFITLVLAILILLLQVVLGFVRSISLSPQQKKRLRSQRQKN